MIRPLVKRHDSIFQLPLREFIRLGSFGKNVEAFSTFRESEKRTCRRPKSSESFTKEARCTVPPKPRSSDAFAFEHDFQAAKDYRGGMESRTPSPKPEYAALHRHLKDRALELRRENAQSRIRVLSTLERALWSRRKEAIAALNRDLGRPTFEAALTEIYATLHELKVARRHLTEWMRPRRVPARLMYLGTESWIYREPKGAVLVISPWNYPLYLALAPVIAALAAGNSVCLKPSEISRHTETFLTNLIREVFHQDARVKIVNGGPETSRDLLTFAWDHVFFTGSASVGREIMNQAARTLSPVTLELGGKSPAIVDRSAHLREAARKIAWGKILNAGQTCVAPDEVYVHAEVKDRWLEEFQKALNEFYPHPDSDIDFARPVNSRHHERLLGWKRQALAMGAKVVARAPGLVNAAFPLEVMTDVPDLAALRQEEIFGPLLPLETFHDWEALLARLRARPKPLALYLFTGEREVEEKVLTELPAGGICINETTLHLGNENLPFGGIGASGMGAYHGETGFRAFSHEKSVLIRRRFGWMTRILYPPYTGRKERLLDWMIRLGL